MPTRHVPSLRAKTRALYHTVVRRAGELVSKDRENPQTGTCQLISSGVQIYRLAANSNRTKHVDADIPSASELQVKY